MRLRLEASPDELSDRAPALLAALAKAIEPFNADLADVLLKGALSPVADSLKHPALRDLLERTHGMYDKQVHKMLGEIGDVLEGRIPEWFQKADAVLEKTQKDPETGEPLGPGDPSPITGKPLPEPDPNGPDPDDPPEPKEESEGEEPEEKSMDWPAGQRRVQALLKRRGYVDADFAPGGALHGWTTSELLNAARSAREELLP